METRNITLSVPKDLLRKIKFLALERETSVSGLLVDLLRDLIVTEDAYEKGWRRASARMETGFNLGTGGSIDWSREEIYER